MPFGLGEFEDFPTLRNSVCGGCNNLIGALERHLCRGASPESFYRRIVGVKGRKGHKPHNPFTEGVGGYDPISVHIPDPESGDSILWEFLGPGEVRQVPQVVLRGDGGSCSIRISVDTGPDELTRSIEATGFCTDQIAYALASYDEQGWVARLLKGVGKAVKFPEKQRPPFRISDWVKVDYQVGPEYFRAVAKIALHYWLTAVPEVRGDEAELEPIRSYILRDGPVESFVRQRKSRILAQVPPYYVHVLAVKWEPSHVLAHLQFFLGQDNPNPIAFRVKLADRLPRSVSPSGSVGHVFTYFPQGPRGRYSGEAISLTTPTNSWRDLA